MTQQLQLVQFPQGDEGQIYEVERPEILTATINSDLAERLVSSDVLETIKLYEDASLESFSELVRLKDDQIGNALKIITSQLLHLIESDRVKGLLTMPSDPDVAGVMNELQSISSAYQVVKMKQDTFGSVDAAMVVFSA